MPGNVVLLNSTKHSVSTSQHQSQARRATSHMTQLFAPDLEELTHTNRYHGDMLDASTRRIGDGNDESDKAILAYVVKHIRVLEQDTAAYLLTLAGKPNPAALARKYAREAAASDKSDKLALERMNRESALADARMIADVKPSDFDVALRNIPDAYNPDYEYAIRIKRLVAAHKATKKAGYKVMTAKVWARLKATRAAHLHYSNNENLFRENRDTKRYIRELRAQIAAYIEPNRAEWSGNDLTRFRQCIDTLLSIHNNRTHYAKHIARRLSKAVPALQLLREEINAELIRVVAIEDERNERARAERIRLRDLAQAERLAEWIAGNPEAHLSNYTNPIDGKPILRVVRDELQTSLGASVPLSHAIRVFKMVKLCRDTGTAWKRNGHTLRVGHFQVDAIAATGDFEAGCHSISWSEVERVAKQIGVFDTVEAANTTEGTETHA
jgi:hypothetical protein